ncbi:hypothetical protein GCM10010302_03150 [Streptomyces polychromogenes]|uniref:Serine/threonine protein kinase n=1 Tax=Streptomyces polychromogenes TaxID=67342 RepID=A0ABN0V0L7_9ACTN
MSSEEIQLTLTPAQAAAGATVDVPLASGTARLRIPPARDGDLVRARVGDQEVRLRIRVSQPAAHGPTVPGPFGPVTVGQPASPPSGKSGALGCLLALGVTAAVIIGVVVASSDDDHSRPTASATPSSTYSPYSPYTPPTYSPPTYSTPTYSRDPATDPAAAPTYALPSPSPTTEAPRPFDEGTCLNGQLPDSTTATRVTGVHEVSCKADDAHYRVIQRFPGTSDMSRCDQNSDTEYGFSYRYTINGSVLNEYVYCLVGLGSYARG